MSQIWIELARSLPSIVTAGTAVVGVVIAKQGLERWRRETIGKRKAELAEEVLADFYQARDVIQAARSPLSHANEGVTRQKAPGETEAQTGSRNAYFAVAERLQNKSDFFAQLQARRYRFRALFGTEATKPYDELIAVYNEIVIAVRMLITMEGRRPSGAEGRNAQRWESTVWWTTPEEDVIAKRLDAAVAAIEITCRPAI